jgi:hypothetical protein
LQAAKQTIPAGFATIGSNAERRRSKVLERIAVRDI